MFRKAILLTILGSILSINAQVISDKTCEPKAAGKNAGDTGCVQLTYQNKTVSYITVRAADGNEWLQQNLGSTTVATSIDDEKCKR